MIEEPATITIARDLLRPTPAQIAAFQGVPTGFVVDAMFGQGALGPQIAPLGAGIDIACQAAGPALVVENSPADILALLCALKFVAAGDVVINAVSGHQGCAAAGDLVTGMMKNAGAAGFVTDGPMRDYAGLVSVGLPCWCTGLTPGSPFCKGPGRVGQAVSIAGQQVAQGDMIVADRDGVVVVPHARIDEVASRLPAIEAAEAELEAKVADGLRIPPEIEAFLDGDDVAFLEAPAITKP